MKLKYKNNLILKPLWENQEGEPWEIPHTCKNWNFSVQTQRAE